MQTWTADAPAMSSSTASVPRLTPPTLLPGYPNPVRLALSVDVHPSGIPLRDFRCSLHSVLQAEDGDGVRRIMLQAGERLNRDFILRFRVGENAVKTSLALLPDGGVSKEGTFALTLVPPEGSLQAQRPREIRRAAGGPQPRLVDLEAEPAHGAFADGVHRARLCGAEREGE